MKSFKIIAVLLTVAAASVITLTAFTASQQNLNNQNIVELASETESLSTLVTAVKAAGLVETLQGDGPFTVFAPTNEAFAALPQGTVENLLLEENRDQLIQILSYHVVSGKVMSGDLSDGMMAETVEGSQIEVSISGYSVKIDNASVLQADIEASNGVVHLIDTVIMPE